MKNFFKPILNKKGLTLAEILVVLFISSVILVITANLMQPVQNLLNSVRSNAHMDTMCNTANEFIRGKIQAAKSVKIYSLTDNNMLPSGGGAVPDVSNEYVIAVLNVKPADEDHPDAAPEYRLFDFGKVASGNDVLTRINESVFNIDNAVDEYAVFNEAFYENSSCNVEFYSDGSRFQIRSQCKRDGEAVNQKCELKFNFLNKVAIPDQLSSSLGFSSSVGGVDEGDEDQYVLEGGAYLIVYTRVAT